MTRASGEPGPPEGIVEPGWSDPRFRAGLGRAFPGWGGEAYGRFYLARDLGEGAPDVLALEREGALVAGIAVNYRRLRTADGEEARAAILSAGWTKPEERGRGRYRRLAAAAVDRAAGRGARWVLGLVTAANTSGRGMAALGSTLVPTWYCAGGEDRGAMAAGEPLDDGELPALGAAPPPAGWKELAAATERDRRRVTSIAYPDPAAWRSQFLDRPHPVELVEAGSARALVERAGGTDRLLLVSPARAEGAVVGELAARARSAGRRLFCYVTGPARRRAAIAAGLAARAGRLTVLPLAGPEGARAGRGVPGRWHLEAGDRM